MKFRNLSLIAAAVTLLASSCGIVKQHHTFECRKDLSTTTSQKTSSVKPEAIVSNATPAAVTQLAPQPAIGQNSKSAIAETNKIKIAKSNKPSAVSQPAKQVQATQAVKHNNAPAKNTVDKKSTVQKSETTGTKSSAGDDWLIALLLCFFLGYLGIHRFYLGYMGIGILMLCTGGVFGILWLIDLVRILLGDLKPNGGDYSN